MEIFAQRTKVLQISLFAIFSAFVVELIDMVLQVSQITNNLVVILINLLFENYLKLNV